MYGTIARMKLKPGAAEKMAESMKEFEGLKVPGYKGSMIYKSDKDPNEIFMVVAFESREAYHKNANDPEQNKRYQSYRDMLTAEPEWHDGEVVYSNF